MTDPTPAPGIPDRLAAALADRYRLERELGEGGMATVYLAEDLKHGRRVAVKVLRPELAAVIGAERFVAEIRTTANLQHPHILPLFDSGEADGFLFYVMPYVEGESLEGRLRREKQLPTGEAVQMARDIAEALDYAHRQGIVHRDIKPANILLQEGRPLVADFGIALAVSAAGTGRMTETGLSLGTPHYMSPEQASADRDLDPRADVYSLGCLLYEMLVGEPPHTGASAQSVLVKILTEEPRPVLAARRTVPRHVSDAVSRAIEKLPADRFPSAAAFAEALRDEDFRHEAAGGDRDPAALPTGPGAGKAPGGTPRWVFPVVAASVVIAGAALLWSLASAGARVSGSAPLLATLEVDDLTVATFAYPRISPDGAFIVVAADTTANGRPGRLFIRGSDEPRFRVLSDDPGVTWLDFSPDSRWVVFATRAGRSTQIKRVPVTGGQPTTVVELGERGAYDLHWGHDDRIYFFSGNPAGGGGRVSRVPASGGGEEVLLEDAPWAFDPVLLPDGNGLLMLNSGPSPSVPVVYDMVADSVVTLDLPGARSPLFVPPDYLVFAHAQGGVRAVAFDPRTYTVTGTPRTVLEASSGTEEHSQLSLGDRYPSVHLGSSGRRRGDPGARGAVADRRRRRSGQSHPPGLQRGAVRAGGRPGPLRG